MTHQEKYAQLALKLGDFTVKKWGIEAEIENIKEELKKLDQEIATCK